MMNFNEAFPYFRCRWIDVGFTRVLALRLSYAGELGWELHMPMDAALPAWDAGFVGFRSCSI